MHRVDLPPTGDEVLTALPDNMHEELLALIDEVADGRERGAEPMATANAVLRGQCWFAYVVAGGVFIVLDAGTVLRRARPALRDLGGSPQGSEKVVRTFATDANRCNVAHVYWVPKCPRRARPGSTPGQALHTVVHEPGRP